MRARLEKVILCNNTFEYSLGLLQLAPSRILFGKSVGVAITEDI